MSSSEPVALELKDLSAQLKRIEQRLKTEQAPDSVALNEFRQSVDNVRLTAWSVSELINAQRAGNQHDSVVAFLSAERVRRLDQLTRNLCGDLERRVITAQSYGIQSLFDSINTLQQRLKQCLTQRPQGGVPGSSKS
ncbi:MAG TPA: hypothetical protein VN669_10880 [Candidatus Acidoferrales bacterium]|jgi:hypothetical protein|nr:hypothetical protein [Candidatus Acidoferrales bacterium]